MKSIRYKLVVNTDVELENIEVKLLESLDWEQRPKYVPVIQTRSLTNLLFTDIVDTMKQQHYKNIFWNFKSYYQEKQFIDNYEYIMTEQFDDEDEIEVNIDFIIENLLGINVSEMIAAHDELFEDLLDLAQEIRSTLINCNEVMFGSIDKELCFIYNSELFDIDCERCEEREHK